MKKKIEEMVHPKFVRTVDKALWAEIVSRRFGEKDVHDILAGRDTQADPEEVKHAILDYIEADVGMRVLEAGLLSHTTKKPRDSHEMHRRALGEHEDAARYVYQALQMGTVRSTKKRLSIFRSRRIIELDGRNILLSMTGFDAFLGAAEKVVAGQAMLTYQELYFLTNRASHRDVMNELRDQIEKHGLSRKEAFDLVKTVRGRGMTIGLAKSDIDIRD